MKIGIDAGSLGVDDNRLKVGVYQLSFQLLSHLSKTDRKNQYLLYSFYPIENEVLRKFEGNFCNVVVKPKKAWASLWLPLKARKDKIDVFIGLNQYVPNLLPKKTKKIGLIYDLAFLEHPQMFHDSKRQLERITDTVVSNSNDIITISNKSKEDILKYYKVEKSKIHALYLGSRKLQISKKKKENYFLYIGALKRSKNVPSMIRSFDLFQKRHPSDIKLVIVGGDKWLDDNIQVAMDDVAYSTKNKIVFKGHVSDKTLEKLYSHAIAFVSPSFYEGFGLTHVEAMAAGVPVIASDRGSLPEVVGDAGILVPPDSPEKIAQSMDKIYSNKKLSKELSKKGKEKSKKYSWNKFARGVYKIIQSYE